MAFRIVEITRDSFDSIPRPANHHFNCQECFYWMGKMDGRTNLVKQKKSWFRKRKRRHGGSLGKLLLSSKQESPVAFVQFGPISEFSTAQLFYKRIGDNGHFPESKRPLTPKGGWCIACVAVQTPYRGKGLATRLVRNVLRDLKQRGIKSVDAYPLCKASSWNQVSSGPARLWEKCGFKKVGEVGYTKGEPIPCEDEEISIMRKKW